MLINVELSEMWIAKERIVTIHTHSKNMIFNVEYCEQCQIQRRKTNENTCKPSRWRCCFIKCYYVNHFNKFEPLAKGQNLIQNIMTHLLDLSLENSLVQQYLKAHSTKNVHNSVFSIVQRRKKGIKKEKKTKLNYISIWYWILLTSTFHTKRRKVQRNWMVNSIWMRISYVILV